MAAPLLYFVVAAGGRIAYRYGTKKIAEQMAKRLGGKVTKKAPKNAQIKKGPSPSAPGSSPKLNQPQGAKSGKFQKPSPSPAPRRPTQPSKPSAPSTTSPARPNTQTTAPARPKPSTKAPAKPTGGSTGSRNTGGRGRKKAPLMDKKLVRERPNLPPKPQTSRPAIVRDSARPAAPEIDKDSIRDTTKRGPEKRTSPKAPKKQEGPSKRGKPSVKTNTVNPGPSERGRPTKPKKMSPGSSPKPKLRPDTMKPTKKPTKPKVDPLKGWSDSRRKALGSDKIGKDAGDGMVWIVMGNSNGLTRVKPSDPRVAEQKRLKKFL
jgi:hypothetical protein